MATWWEERRARVTQAAAIVSVQAHCPPGEAMTLLRERADRTGSDLEDTALALVAHRISFDRTNSAADV
jgi:hypothetical protein